ncbi:MAG: phosphopantetheine-binding protein [Methylophilus sp.]|uniref:phosphopantetheine-binding protein n=1 Tax=Methylophilus sp. TaxID=29541 RepID=UPI003FA195DA
MPSTLEIKQLVIDALDLEEVTTGDIDDDMLLFDASGLGLDSIDALEIGVALRKKYQIQIEATNSDNRNNFQSVKNLAEFVTRQLEVQSQNAQQPEA